MIDILHMSPWPLGGSTSYVVHLARTFAAAGVPARVLRLSTRTESKKRQMGEYGVFYQNVSLDDLRRSNGVPLLASAPTDPDVASKVADVVLQKDGKFVFHDPNEFRIYPHWNIDGVRERVICIRQQGLNHLPGVFIPHPYVRHDRNAPQRSRPRLAVSIARTSAVKNSHWILEANMHLKEPERVELCGDVNRMWWNFNVSKKYPDYPYPATAGFPRRFGAAVDICKPFQIMVDLTIFKDDGGGTQYSLLEAMDAGAVPVMTKDWCSYPGPARDFGFRVDDAAQLMTLLRTAASGVRTFDQRIAMYRRANYNYIDRVHNPDSISEAYVAALGV